MSVTIAIPSYRCQDQLPRVLQELQIELDQNPDFDRRIDAVVVIDNQSPDQTLQRACQFKSAHHFKKLWVIKNKDNYGLGGSHKVALKFALQNQSKYLAIVHGDHQAKVSELKDLLEFVKKDPSLDAVLGSRFSKDSRLMGYSKLRTYGNKALNWVYSGLFFKRTFDLGSGLNLFKVEALNDPLLFKIADAFTFNMDLLLYFYSKDLKIKFFPITWSETDQVSNAKTFAVGWRALKTALRWRMGSPLLSKKTREDFQWDQIA